MPLLGEITLATKGLDAFEKNVKDMQAALEKNLVTMFGIDWGAINGSAQPSAGGAGGYTVLTYGDSSAWQGDLPNGAGAGGCGGTALPVGAITFPSVTVPNSGGTVTTGGHVPLTTTIGAPFGGSVAVPAIWPPHDDLADETLKKLIADAQAQLAQQAQLAAKPPKAPRRKRTKPTPMKYARAMEL
jgi:hypothetical protein